MEQAFTSEDRNRIRGALVSYAKAHQIGVPTLRERIAKATGRTRNVPSGNDPYLIDQKTLQRFLKNSHRTNDAFLVPLAEFVSRHSVGERDDLLSSTLAAYFGAPLPVESMQALADTTELAGTYEIYGPRTLFPDESDLPASARWRGRAAASGNVVFSANQGRFALNIRESEYLDGSALNDDQRCRNVCEGALIQFGAVIFAVLRNQLSRLPKSYWLRLSADGALAGTVIEGSVRRDVESDYVYTASDDYLFRKIEEEEP